jgi:hypothetical protein
MNIKIAFTLFSLIFLIKACSAPELNGHYHLLYKHRGERFQVWNIYKNQLIINKEICPEKKDCFETDINFRGDSLSLVWVDAPFQTKYYLEPNGIVVMYNKRDSMYLVPYTNCLKFKTYFHNKINKLSDSIQLLSDAMTGRAEFPAKFQNELIVGFSKNVPFFMFNGQILKQDNNRFNIPKVNNQEVWVYIDNKITLEQVMPILLELYQRGYKIDYGTMISLDNNEQVGLIRRKFKNFKQTKSKKYEISYCEYCTKYPNVKIDSVINIKMLKGDLFVMNGETNDLFQTRNSLVRYLGQNKTTRLNTEIQIEIPKNTYFLDYLYLVDELNWVHIEISDITYYNGRNDKDATWIRQKQEENKAKEILNEFPIRIKEIIF